VSSAIVFTLLAAVGTLRARRLGRAFSTAASQNLGLDTQPERTAAIKRGGLPEIALRTGRLVGPGFQSLTTGR
jgi:hypothetical protein